MSERIRVAILGAGGRVGSALLRLLSSEPRVSAFGVCRNHVIAGPLRLAGLEVRCGTLRDRASAEALLGQPDIVVNCAVDAGWATTARDANRRVLRAVSDVRGVAKIVQFSSIGVYGTCIARGRATSDRPRPHARYAHEKLDQERAAIRYQVPGTTTLVLRMGHVYGPYQWLSRSIFEFLAARRPDLPFDGGIASNAVHIENVCRAVAWIVLADVPGGTYDLVDRPQHTWRELVDWHADAIGVPSVEGMDDDRSRRLAERYRAMESVPLVLQLGREFVRSLASFPSSFAVSSPTAIVVGQRILGALRWPRLEAALRAAHAITRARRDVAADAAVDVPPWLLSDETPGPELEYPSGPLQSEDQRAVAAWYRGYAVPATMDELPRP